MSATTVRIYHRFEFNQHRFGSQVLKIAFFGTLGAPVNKQNVEGLNPTRA